MTTTVQPNKNTKSILARILATENIFVIHDKNASTASFDMRKRVLRLPVFKNMTDELYDMLVGHEVAHALYTPYTERDEECIKTHGVLSDVYDIAGGDVPTAKVVHGYMNIIEDARIERLIKEKFGGLRRDFHVGYSDLHKNRDFFGLKSCDISTLSFIDRINLHFKIGSIETIPFSDEERIFVDMVENTRTFSEVVDVTRKIWEYAKEKKKQSSDSVSVNLTPVYGKDGDSIQANGDSKNLDSDSISSEMGGEKWSDKSLMPDQAKTQKNFDESLKSMRNNSKYGEVQNYSLPSVKMENCIVPYTKVLEVFSPFVNSNSSQYAECEKEGNEFIANSNRVVNILVQEFMAKKAAKDHARSQTHRTGCIDSVRMMNYKFSDDIFRRMKIVPKGKSHGLVFFMDFSGSMSPILGDTIRQMIQIVLFCRRVNIPYEVYAFTTKNPSGYEIDSHSFDEKEYENCTDKIWKKNEVPFEAMTNPMCPFYLMNIFSSKMNKNEFNMAIRNIFAVVSYYSKRGYTLAIPSMMHLSSTPLVECINAAIDIVPKFKSDNKIDIVNTIFMTDGESTGSAFYGGDDCWIYVKGQSFKYDRKMSRECNMVKIFREVTGSKVVNFFLSETKSSIAQYIDARYIQPVNNDSKCNHPEDNKQSFADDQKRSYEREGFAVGNRNRHGYDDFYILRANQAIEDVDLDELLSSKKTNGSIRKVFNDTLTKQISSRIMLNRFISLIAKD